MGTGGQILGGALGAFVGFWIGRPFMGFSLGWGVGTLVDPPDFGTPNQPGIDTPNIEKMDLQIYGYTTSEEALPLPEVLGTTKLPGNIAWYGNNRTVSLETQREVPVNSGKGALPGSQPDIMTQTVLTGYSYYLTWVHGICAGPVDTLHTIMADGEVIWSGTINRDDPALENGTVAITLNGGMGTVFFHFGTGDHATNASIHTDRDFNFPYRNLCYALFLDVCLGTVNRVPTFNFVLSNRPEIDFSAKSGINFYDYNPAHAIWRIATELCGLPEASLSETSFASAASTFHNEGLGIGLTASGDISAKDAISTILKHTHAILPLRSDGKYHLVPIRKDYDAGNLPVIDESVLVGYPTIERGSFVETTGEVKVEFSKVMQKEWGGSIRIVIDHTRIDSDLYNYPLLIRICGGSGGTTYFWDKAGINAFSSTQFMTKMQTAENRKKVKFSSAFGEPLYAECTRITTYSGTDELDGFSLLLYWVIVPFVSSSEDTVIYLFYDPNGPDYLYTDDQGSPITQEGWKKTPYESAWHLYNPETDRKTTRDSCGRNDVVATGLAGPTYGSKYIGEPYLTGAYYRTDRVFPTAFVNTDYGDGEPGYRQFIISDNANEFLSTEKSPYTIEGFMCHGLGHQYYSTSNDIAAAWITPAYRRDFSDVDLNMTAWYAVRYPDWTPHYKATGAYGFLYQHLSAQTLYRNADYGDPPPYGSFPINEFAGEYYGYQSPRVTRYCATITGQNGLDLYLDTNAIGQLHVESGPSPAKSVPGPLNWNSNGNFGISIKPNDDSPCLNAGPGIASNTLYFEFRIARKKLSAAWLKANCYNFNDQLVRYYEDEQ